MSGLPRLTVTAAIAVLLTAISLQPTLQDTTWLLPTALLVAVVAITGYLARRYGVPRLLIPLAQVGVLAVAGVLRFAQDVAVFGFLPGRDVLLTVQALVTEATDTISTVAAPAPLTPGLTFLLALSVALVAIVVDTIAVTYRSPALAGVPLLVLYAVPVAVVANGVSWVYFGLAATGWLALLLADGRERVGGWGRRLGTRTYAGDPAAPNPTAPPEPLGALGRRIGIAAVGLAVVLPAVVPGLSEAVFGRGGGSGSGSGGGTITTVNPFVSLGDDLNRPDDTEVLRYTTDVNRPDYLRLVTLDTFDGKTWLPASLETSGRIATDPLPPPTGLSVNTQRSQVTTQLTSTELTGSTWLPMPYPPTAVAVSGPTAEDWLYDSTNRVIWSPKSDSANTTWSVTSLSVDPTRAQLKADVTLDPVFLTRYTQLPELPPIVKQTAQEVTREADGNFEKAVALQDYFNDGSFVYDPTTPSTANDPLTTFLTSKRGFCQQFAGAYAAMARSLGIPTRLVVGFVPGEQDANGSWSVTWHDTHAWPEVYFEGVGWTRFEPTPRNDNGGIRLPTYTLPETQQPGVSGNPRQGGEPRVPRTRDGEVFVPPKADAGQGPGAVDAVETTSPSFPWVWVLVPLAVVGLALIPWAIRRQQRRRRLAVARTAEPVRAATAAWDELAATSLDLARAWPDSRTPRQVARGLADAAALPDLSASALWRIALATERARYARTATPVDGLADDVLLARRGLLEATGRRRRILATFAPASLLTRVSTRTADLLDWVDASPRRARRALGARRDRRASRRTTQPAVRP